jgi:hypothetical protein
VTAKKLKGELRMADKMFNKVVISGNVVEVYEYEGPVFYNFKKPKKEPDDDHIDKETGEVLESNNELSDEEIQEMEEKEQKEQEMYDALPDNVKHLFGRKKEYRKSAVYRARTTLRRLINANFDENSKFVTLTFADGSIPDVTDITRANKEFGKFRKRMNRYLKKQDKSSMKYATVVEFQDKEGRGAVHYHLICDLSWLPHEDLERLWGHGWVGINALKAKMREDGKDVDNVGAYMIKYMIKNFNDPRLKGQKMYFTSLGLKKPIEIKGLEASSFLWLNQFDQKKTVFTSEYGSEYHGLIQYREYNMKRSSDQLNFMEKLPKAQ